MKTVDRNLLASRAEVPDHVVFRSFAAETVVLNLETGKYHGLNPVAGRMLEVLKDAADLGEAAESLAAEYDEPLDMIATDLCQFCSELAERGLIQLAAPAT